MKSKNKTQKTTKTTRPPKRLRLGIGLLAAAILSIALAIFFWPSRVKDLQQENRATPHQTIKKNKRQSVPAQKVKKADRKPQIERLPIEKKKPKINLEDEEYVGLSPEMRSIMTQLQDALENENEKNISTVCAKIQKIMQERGEDAVPVVVRENAVEALGLSLPHSLPELMGFMADGNPDVREAVHDELDDLFNDPTIGDRNLGPILTTLSKIATDEDLVDSMIMSLESDLRNSVKVETYKEILRTGTEEVKEKVRESIDELLEIDDDVTLTDAQREKALDKYLKEEPDDDDDDALFGTDPDTDDDN